MSTGRKEPKQEHGSIMAYKPTNYVACLKSERMLWVRHEYRTESVYNVFHSWVEEIHRKYKAQRHEMKKNLQVASRRICIGREKQAWGLVGWQA